MSLSVNCPAVTSLSLVLLGYPLQNNSTAAEPPASVMFYCFISICTFVGPGLEEYIISVALPLATR